MANCPNCGSGHIALKNKTDINWGRAIAGWTLFGTTGALIGGLTGEDRTANVCLDCSTAWNAKDLYKILQTIKISTGKVLNLSRETDRVYMTRFIEDVGPSIDGQLQSKKKAEQLLSKCDKDSLNNSFYMFSILTICFLFTVIFLEIAFEFGISSLLIPIPFFLYMTICALKVKIAKE